MRTASVSGLLAGLVLAPATGLISGLRRSRMFHPCGVLCSADVRAAPALSRQAAPIASRLTGPALVRWSSAWWKNREWIDALGCAIRFTELPLGVEPKPDDQDLLLATIQRPWTLPFAPLTTHTRDFLSNAYFGVSPFEVAPIGRVEWRLRALAQTPSGGSRRERLARAIDRRQARLLLEWARYPGPLSRPLAHTFEPLVEIVLTGFVALDQALLRFDPFRAGRGLEPVGFVHAMRRAAYWSSQASRP